MPTFLGYEFVDLTTAPMNCSNVNWWYLADNNSPSSFGTDEAYFETAPQSASAFLSHVSSQYANGDATLSECINALEGYKQYLIGGYNILGSGTGGGESNLGWSGKYWYWRGQTGWFGASTNASCNKNRSWHATRHESINNVRALYSDVFELVDNAIENTIELEEDAITFNEWEQENNTIINDINIADQEYQARSSSLNNIRLANVIEILAIGGAFFFLVLAFTNKKK